MRRHSAFPAKCHTAVTMAFCATLKSAAAIANKIEILIFFLYKIEKTNLHAIVQIKKKYAGITNKQLVRETTLLFAINDKFNSEQNY